MKDTLDVTKFNALYRGVRDILAVTKQPDAVVIEIYGPIGATWDGTGITASSVSAALKGPEKKAVVRINSPGGSAFEGLAIYNVLKTSGKTVAVMVDGLAASAASVIAMAGDTVTMNAGTMLMIHPAQALAMGSAKDLRETADLCDLMTTSMAGIYAARSGQPVDSVVEMMNAETWMSEDDAVKFGFADETGGADSEIAALAKDFDLGALYSNTPESLKALHTEVKPAENAGMSPGLARRRLEFSQV